MVEKSFYVDDLNTSVQSIAMGMQLYQKIKSRFLEASLNVRKWHSNSVELQKYFNECEGSIDHKEELKVLGILWRKKHDQLIISMDDLLSKNDLQAVPTKRTILSAIASIYDPLGFLQPIVIKFMILFQRICLSDAKWDDKISDNLEQKWFNML